ncbi:acetate--CoA ligase family protein [Geminicoccus roseus]|uniref:acetate--CoA ligase family protein n=1 Tax=Geminicoccus roseus TaxID=404900 RepID=UPI0004106C01|nr:acetate--CoA ligase family protein [Geminicoccus roseus]
MSPLNRLLAPRSVAVIAGRYAGPAIRQLRRIGFAGTIHVVSATRSSIEDIATLPTVADLPPDVDAAFLAVPAASCPDLVALLRDRGCGGVVCFSSGFAETGARDLQVRLAEAAGAMPLLGPNCHGLISGLDRVALWPDEHGVAPIERGVAILSQSGNIAINFTMQQRSVPIGLVVSLGNQAMLDAAPFLRHAAADPRITAVGLHLEGLTDPAAFAEAALAAEAAGKPVVVLKTGRSPAGGRATITHTSTLAGSARVYDAFFARLGIVQATTVAGFLETLKLLHVLGRRPGRRICSASCSGGEAALLADLAERHGLEMPSLEPEHARAIEEALDGQVRADNPLDYQTFIWGSGKRQEQLFFALLAKEFDTSVLVLDYPTQEGSEVSSWDITLEAWISAVHATGRAAAVVASLPECLPSDRRDRLLAAGIVPMQGMGESVEAIAAASVPPSSQPGLVRWPDLRGGPVTTMREGAAKAMLARHGIPVPPGRIVDLDDAAAAAVELGLPVVVKCADPSIAHKSDAGGVALDLRTAAQVSAAAAGMSHLGPQVLVESMVSGVVAEVIVGMVREPGFGPVLVVGAGGVLAEFLDDSATLLFPFDRASVEQVLAGLRLSRLLDGYRGGPPGDRAALVEAILGIGEFVLAQADRLVEMDLNPLLVLAEGQGVVVVDALLRMVDP